MIDTYTTVDKLAAIFDVTERTIQLWVDTQGMPKADRGEYPLIKCLQWYVKKLKDEIAELKKDSPLNNAKLEYQKMMNKEKSLKIQKIENSQIDAVMVKSAWLAQMGIISQNFDALLVSLNRVIDDDDKYRLVEKEFNEYKKIIANTELDLTDDLEREFENQAEEENE